MIAIPNMSKPKSCIECWSGLAIVINCEAGTSFHNPDGDLIPPDCPLIDIVYCKECKYWHNHEWSNTCDKNIGNGFPSDYFCADGERRADERY